MVVGIAVVLVPHTGWVGLNQRFAVSWQRIVNATGLLDQYLRADFPVGETVASAHTVFSITPQESLKTVLASEVTVVPVTFPSAPSKPFYRPRSIL